MYSKSFNQIVMHILIQPQVTPLPGEKSDTQNQNFKAS